ncbi:MAG: hypothetical protein ABW321_02795 [Polyangiales bacterium]
MSRWGVLSAAFALATLILSSGGCNEDECDATERRCEGRELLTCNEPSCHVPGCMFTSHRYWSRETCPHVCAEEARAAFCADSVEEDPICLRTERCEDNTAVSCIAGHVIARHPCGDGVCVTTDWGEPVCVQSSTPHPRCDTLQRAEQLCDGSNLLTCYGRHVRFALACQFACVTTSDGAFCAAASDPDPRCVGLPMDRPVERPALTCPDGTRGGCKDGFIECYISPDVVADTDAGSG